MLGMEVKQGITHIVFTPHFYAQKVSVEKFLSRREHSSVHLKEKLQDTKLDLQLYCGAEVYYFPGIGKADMLPQLCIEGTDIVLLEMPFAQWDKQMVDDVRKIIEKQRLTVVLAHVERFIGFQKDKSAWDEMMKLPLYTQLNGECFLHWRSRRFGLKHLQERDNQVLLGSDCHNLTSRQPNLQEARDIIRKKLGADTLEEIDALGKDLLHI